jgi:hypothetical protein
MAAPVTTRVRSFPETERALSNMERRLAEIERAAGAAGQRWRLWPGEACVIGNSANAFTRVNGRFIAGVAQNVFLPLGLYSDERLVAVHALVDVVVGPISLFLRRSGVQAGPSDVSAGTGGQLLSVLDAGAVVRRDEFAAFDVRLLLANTDQVVAIATITEPA